MNTIELIKAGMANLSEKELKEAHRSGKKSTRSRRKSRRPNFMTKLRNIKIDAPEDFAVNFDLYVSGEKRVG
jgi:hypothetical protein